MVRTSTLSAFFLPFVFATTAAAVQQAKPVEGTMVLDKRTYKLAHVVAYETGSGDEVGVTVLASDRKIPIDQVKAALRKNDGSDEDLALRQPYLMVMLKKSGELVGCRAWADNTQF